MEVIIRATANTRTTLSRLRKNAVSSSSSSSSSFSSSSSPTCADSQDFEQGAGGSSEAVEEDLEEVEAVHLPAFKELYTVQYKKIFAKAKIDMYYPTYWLSFLLLGRHAQKDGRAVLEAGNK